MIAPVRSWQMGREEEIAYAREHGIPVKGGTEVAPYSIDDNLWGRSSEGAGSRTSRTRPRTMSSSSSPGPSWRPTSPRSSRSSSSAACPSARRRAPRAGGAARTRRRDRRAPRRRDRRPHRGPHRRPEGARHLRGPRRRDPPARPPGAREARRARSTRTSSSPSSTASGPTSSTPACGGSRCAATSTPTWSPSTRRSRGTIGLKLYKGTARVVTRSSPNAVYDAALASFAESGGLFSQTASPGFIELWSLQSRMAWRLRNESLGRRRAALGRPRLPCPVSPLRWAVSVMAEGDTQLAAGLRWTTALRRRRARRPRG